MPTKRQFDLTLIVLFFGTMALTLPKCWAARKLAEGGNGVVGDIAGAVAIS